MRFARKKIGYTIKELSNTRNALEKISQYANFANIEIINETKGGLRNVSE